MMKFLRKYNRRILAVAVALLLVSWLIGDPLAQFLSPDPSTIVIGSAFGSTVRARDLRPAENATIILDALGVNWRQPAGLYNPDTPLLKLEHWYLLAREAAESGITVPEADIDRFFQNNQIPPTVVDAIRARHQVSPAQIRAAVAQYLRIQRYGNMITAVNVPSERQIRHYVRDTNDKIAIRGVMFPAGQFVDADNALDPAEVQAQFEQYKEVLASESESGFGYKWPRRVRVEYLAARVADLLPQITISDEELHAYYRKNKESEEFVRREFKIPETQASTPTQPVQAEVVTRTLTFTEAREQIEGKLKKRAATSRIASAMEAIAAELGRPWLGLPYGPDGYKTPPPEVRDPGFLSGAREALEQRFGIPLVFRQTELLTRDDARGEPGIGSAFTIGDVEDQLTFPQYAFRVPSFFDAAAAGETALRLALFQTPDTPLYNTSGGQPYDHFIFRVVEARPPEVPQSIDEVRERVEKDVRLKHAYQTAGDRAREFFVSARNAGVDAAYLASPDLQDPRFRGAFVPRSSALVARRESLGTSNLREYLAAAAEGKPTLRAPYTAVILASDEEFTDKCFEMASPLWTPPQVELPPTTRPVAVAPADKPAGHTVNLIELPKRQTWVVVELIETEPVREDAYKTRAFEEARQQLIRERMIALRTRWFDPQQIEQRCGFARAAGEDAEG